jgi:branched-chain amino acid transport system substrate-binding protein
MKGKARLALLTTAGLATLLVMQIPTQAVAACALSIGAMGPFTGAPDWATAMADGVRFVAAVENKAGGLKVGDEKCHLSVVTYDAKYTAEGGAAGANYFASKGIKFIVGPVGSPETTGVKPVAERNGQITINFSYAKNAIQPQYPLAFHGDTGPLTWAYPVASAAHKEYQFKSVALIAPNDQGGTDIASVDAVAYRKLGIKATENYYQRGISNFAPIVQRILNERAEAVDTASTPPTYAATIAKQLRQAGFAGPIGRLGGPGTAQILHTVGGVEKLKDFYWFSAVPPEPRVRAVWPEYQKVMGKAGPNNSIMVQSIAATRVLFAAISKAGTTGDAAKVAAAMRKLPLDDPNLGKGVWTGQKQYGINQEMAFAAGVGFIRDGKNLGVRPIAIGVRSN